MPNLKKVRIGFISTGAITHYAADSIKTNPNAEIVAAYDPSPERLADFCAKKQVAKSFDSVEALLACDQIDALYVAPPNKFHVPLAIQALEAGKHVILEKPFAMSYADAKRAADLSKKLGLTLMIGMNQRFTADSQKIKSLVQQGVLGDIYHAKAYWRRRSGIPRLGTWFGSKELAGGGSLYDIGVHMLDLCLYLMDNYEPVSVTGATYTKFGNRGLGEGSWGISERSGVKFEVDDFASAFIRFANGATVTLDATWAGHTEIANRENVELFGTEAGASARPAKLFRFGEAERFSAYEVVDVVNVPNLLPHTDRFHNFINHLAGQEELFVKLEEALVVQRILDAVAESSKSGREVRLDG